MGDRVGVSASTIRTRIEHLDDGGVIRGYHKQAGYSLRSADISDDTLVYNPPPYPHHLNDARLEQFVGGGPTRYSTTDRWSFRARAIIRPKRPAGY